MRIILILAIFVLSLLQSSILHAQQEAISCKPYKTGKFVTLYGVKVTRKLRTQKEVWIDNAGKKHKVWYTIKWLDDCSYQLKMLKTNDKAIRKEFEKHNLTMYVKIIDFEENSYQTKARWMDETDWRYENKLVRVISKDTNTVSPNDDLSIRNEMNSAAYPILFQKN